MLKHEQQLWLLVEGQRQAFVERLVAGGGAEQRVEASVQPQAILRGRVLTVGQQLTIVGPELGEDVGEGGLMLRQVRGQLLEVPAFVDPAQRQLLGDRPELRRIVADQRPDHRPVRIGQVSRERQRFTDVLLLLGAQAAGWAVQQCRQRRLVQLQLARDHRQLRPRGCRQLQPRQMPVRFLIEPIRAWPPPTQHLNDGLTVLLRRRLVRRVERVAHDLAILALTSDPRAGVINVLVRTACQPGLQHLPRLGLEGRPPLGQQVRHRPSRDHDPGPFDQLQDLALAHPPAVRQRHHQRAQVRAERPIVPGRPPRPIDCHPLGPIDPQPILLAPLLPRLGRRPTLLLRRVVRRPASRLPRRDLRSPLPTLQPRQFIPQLLVLDPQRPNLRRLLLDQVQQRPNRLPRPHVRDRRQIDARNGLGDRPLRHLSPPPVVGLRLRLLTTVGNPAPRPISPASRSRRSPNAPPRDASRPSYPAQLRRYPDDPIAFFFDCVPSKFGKDRLEEEFYDQRRKGFFHSKSSIAWFDSKAYEGIQAADFLAYESGREYATQLGRAEYPFRMSGARLVTGMGPKRRHESFLGKEFLDGLVEAVRKDPEGFATM